jgi:hypothetical protein
MALAVPLILFMLRKVRRAEERHLQEEKLL